MITRNLANIPLGRFKLPYKSSFAYIFKWNQTSIFIFLFTALNFCSFIHTFTSPKFWFTLQNEKYQWIIGTVLWALVNIFDWFLRATLETNGLNYLHKIIIANKIVNKINELCHYEFLLWKSPCAKRSFTIFLLY